MKCTVILFAFFLLFFSCKANKDQVFNTKEWTLAWEDDFGVDGFLDDAKWNVIESNTADCGNYMSDHEDRIWVKGYKK